MMLLSGKAACGSVLTTAAQRYVNLCAALEYHMLGRPGRTTPRVPSQLGQVPRSLLPGLRLTKGDLRVGQNSHNDPNDNARPKGSCQHIKAKQEGRDHR